MSRREPQCGKEADKKRSRSPPVSSTLTFSSRIQHCRARRVCRSRKWPSFLLPFEKLPRVHPQLRLPYVEGGCNSRLRCHTEPEEENTVVVLAFSVSREFLSMLRKRGTEGRGRKGKEKKRKGKKKRERKINISRDDEPTRWASNQFRSCTRRICASLTRETEKKRPLRALLFLLPLLLLFLFLLLLLSLSLSRNWSWNRFQAG